MGLSTIMSITLGPEYYIPYTILYTIPYKKVKGQTGLVVNELRAPIYVPYVFYAFYAFYAGYALVAITK